MRNAGPEEAQPGIKIAGININNLRYADNTNLMAEREEKSKGEKESYKHLDSEFQRIARRDKKAFLSDQGKEIEENNRMERLEISSRKLEIPREHFMQRWAQ